MTFFSKCIKLNWTVDRPLNPYFTMCLAEQVQLSCLHLTMPVVNLPVMYYKHAIPSKKQTCVKTFEENLLLENL